MIRIIILISSICVFLISFQTLLFAQDSTIIQPDSAKVYYFFNDFERKGPDFLKLNDTIITGIQRYDPVDKPGNYYATLGNNGLAHKNMVYEPYLKTGFNYGIHSFDKYLFHNDSIRYYWVGRPYTHVKYIMGSKKEQNLHLEHAQNVASWFTLGMKFRYVNSPGYYPRQEADDKNFVITGRFKTRNSRYMVLANYIHNKLKIEENGGIKYDTVFEDNIKDNRNSFLVNLNTAGNYLKENSFYVKQLFKLNNRHRFIGDIDTTSNNPLSKIPLGNISFSTLFSRFTHRYEHNVEDHDFYRYTLDTLNATYDSTYIYKLENELAWTNADNAKFQHLTFFGGVRHLYVELSIDSMKSTKNQLIPFGGLDIWLSKNIHLQFRGDFVTGNSNVGDISLTGELNLKTKFGSLLVKSKYAKQEPGSFYDYYSSNHFIWNNNFRKQDFLINNFEYNYKNFTVGVKISAVGSYVYMDTLAQPQQISNTLGVFNAYVRKLFNAGRWSFDARVIYQSASNKDVIRLPELIGDLSIYYTNFLFKKAAILQTGFDALYNTAYYAYDYMPATKSFYIQNEKEIGNYPYVNFFLNLQIKRAILFIKYHNLGYFLNDFTYYTVPSYPMKDAGFRFGVSWMFYD